MKYQVLLMLIILSLNSFAGLKIDHEALTEKLNKIKDLGYLPGFAVAIVSDEGVHYQEGFGFADVENKRPFSEHTLINIGSTSKTLVGISLMQLVEEGKLSLDTKINDVLPFEIIHPYYPNDAITIKHLATHTSGLEDTFEFERTYLFSEKIQLSKGESPKGFYKYIKRYNKNKPMELSSFIKNMYHKNGEWYKKKNFIKAKPGHEYNYSNMGAAIAGYIIELISGESFMDYSKNHILTKLNMSASAWNQDEINKTNFAKLYLSNDKEIPNYSLVSYADGGLITSVSDLSLYFVEMIKGYYGRNTMLKKSSFQKVMGPEYKSEDGNSGVFWAINSKGEIGHSGGDPGIMTFMFFNPETGIGRIMFTNKSDEGGDGYNQFVYIWKTMEKFILKATSEN